MPTMEQKIAEDFEQYNAQYDRVAWLKEAAPGRVQFWEDAATAGHFQAQFLFAKALQVGAGVEVDERRALFFYEKAADQGFGAAMVNAGRHYAQGKGCQKDIARAMDHQLAADNGYSSGAYNMAILLTEGVEVPRNLPRALELRTQLERGRGARRGRAARRVSGRPLPATVRGPSMHRLIRRKVTGPSPAFWRLGGYCERPKGSHRDGFRGVPMNNEPGLRGLHVH